MAGLILDGFLEPWKGPCAPYTALAIFKPHFAFFDKVEFSAPFWSLWPPLGLMLGTCGATSWKKGRQKGDSQKRPCGEPCEELWAEGERGEAPFETIQFTDFTDQLAFHFVPQGHGGG